MANNKFGGRQVPQASCGYVLDILTKQSNNLNLLSERVAKEMRKLILCFAYVFAGSLCFGRLHFVGLNFYIFFSLWKFRAELFRDEFVLLRNLIVLIEYIKISNR